MTNKVYDTFSELVPDFERRSADALLFGDRKLPEKQGALTYSSFAGLIHSLEEQVRENGTAVDFVRADHDPETLIRIFADVCAGCSVVLIDSAVPPLREKLIRDLLTAKLKKEETGHIDTSISVDMCDDGGAAGSQNKSGEGRLIFFTSGTTHSSKAVVLTSKALLHAAWRGQECLPIGEGDVLLSILPLSHVFGFVCTMLWGLCYGATVALGRGVRHLLDDAKYFRPTVISLVPTLANALTRFGAYNPELKVVLIGAAPLSEAEMAAMRQKTSAKIYTGYGLTETASGVAITEDPADPLSLVVCPGVELLLGEGNEILLRTDSLAERYIELAPREKAPAPLLDQDGFFHTGDIGSFDEHGRIHISGRKKDIIVLPDGNKVFCPEYEKTLSDEIGTDEVAIAGLKGRPVLLISNKVDKLKVQKAVEKLNGQYSRSRQIAQILYIGLPLPRTITGKLKRWLIEKALTKGDFEIWNQ